MQTDRYSSAQSRTQEFDVGLRNYMNSVYNRMTMGVLITAITAYIVSSSQALITLFLGGPQAYIVMLAPLAIIWFGFNPRTMSAKKLQMVFIGLSVIYGISFSMIALTFAGADIARAFFIASAMFAGLSIFGYTTKKDLSGLGSFCMMAFIGLFVTMIVGMFVEFSSQMEMFLSAGIVLVIAGMTAWETQTIKVMYSAAHGAEINSRLAWQAAFSLYLNFIIMFQHILHLTSDR